MTLSQKELPPGWCKLLDEHWEHINSENVDLFNLQEKSAKKSLSLVFKIPEAVGQDIKETLERTVPEIFKDRILFQPSTGYHFTIQWAPEENLVGLDISHLVGALGKLFSEEVSMEGSVLFPYFGRAGLMGGFFTRTEQEVSEIRRVVHKLWQELNLPVGLPPKYCDLAYMSLTRYTGLFSFEEKLILKGLPVTKIPEVVLKEALLVLNDKFMTPEKTQVIGKFPFGSVKIAL